MGEADPEDEAGGTGLYFCRCGPNLGNLIRLGELDDPAAWPSAADVATHEILCSAEGRAWLARRIRERGLERVVVAACSPREHEATFRAVLAGEGRSPFHLQMVNLREQCAWVTEDNIPDITSPASNGELVFLATSDGTLACLDAKSGAMLRLAVASIGPRPSILIAWHPPSIRPGSWRVIRPISAPSMVTG